MGKMLAIAVAIICELVIWGFLYVCWLGKPSGDNPHIIDWIAVIFAFVFISMCWVLCFSIMEKK